MQLKKHSLKKKKALVKNNVLNQHGESKVEKLLHTVGPLSFKTYHRSLSLEKAVSLTPSHAAELCCITMTQECPSLSRKSPQSNNSLGEGKGEKRGEGGSAEGKQKGTWLPLVTAHPQANRGKSITCRIKRKLVHKVKPSESWIHPSKHSFSSVLSSPFIATTPPHLSDSHQRRSASFRHTVWNPTQVRMPSWSKWPPGSNHSNSALLIYYNFYYSL